MTYGFPEHVAATASKERCTVCGSLLHDGTYGNRGARTCPLECETVCELCGDPIRERPYCTERETCATCELAEPCRTCEDNMRDDKGL